MIGVAELTKAMAERNAVVPGKKVKLDFGEEGFVMLDGSANQVSNDDGAADATIRVSLANFLLMAEGKLNGAMAYMQGKLKVDGEMSVALQFQSVTSKLRS